MAALIRAQSPATAFFPNLGLAEWRIYGKPTEEDSVKEGTISFKKQLGEEKESIPLEQEMAGLPVQNTKEFEAEPPADDFFLLQRDAVTSTPSKQTPASPELFHPSLNKNLERGEINWNDIVQVEDTLNETTTSGEMFKEISDNITKEQLGFSPTEPLPENLENETKVAEHGKVSLDLAQATEEENRNYLGNKTEEEEWLEKRGEDFLKDMIWNPAVPKTSQSNDNCGQYDVRSSPLRKKRKINVRGTSPPTRMAKKLGLDLGKKETSQKIEDLVPGRGWQSQNDQWQKLESERLVGNVDRYKTEAKCLRTENHILKNKLKTFHKKLLQSKGNPKRAQAPIKTHEKINLEDEEEITITEEEIRIIDPTIENGNDCYEVNWCSTWKRLKFENQTLQNKLEEIRTKLLEAKERMASKIEIPINHMEENAEFIASGPTIYRMIMRADFGMDGWPGVGFNPPSVNSQYGFQYYVPGSQGGHGQHPSDGHKTHEQQAVDGQQLLVYSQQQQPITPQFQFQPFGHQPLETFGHQQAYPTYLQQPQPCIWQSAAM